MFGIVSAKSKKLGVVPAKTTKMGVIPTYSAGGGVIAKKMAKKQDPIKTVTAQFEKAL